MSWAAVDADPGLERAQVGRAPDVHPPLDDEPAVDAVGEDADEDAGCPGAVQVGPERRQHVVRRRRGRPRRQVAAVVVLGGAATDDEVAVGVDADRAVRSCRCTTNAGTLKLTISSSPIGVGAIAEQVQRQVPARGTAPGRATDGTPSAAPASVAVGLRATPLRTSVAPVARTDLQPVGGRRCVRSTRPGSRSRCSSRSPCRWRCRPWRTDGGGAGLVEGDGALLVDERHRQVHACPLLRCRSARSPNCCSPIGAFERDA